MGLRVLFENLIQLNACIPLRKLPRFDWEAWSAPRNFEFDFFKLFFQKTDGEREDLGEFLYQYLNRRFGVENMIIEWGYNLYDACGRYTHDPRVGLFYGILQKEV